MLKIALTGVAAILLATTLAFPAFAQRKWCEKDCIALCKRTLPAGVTLGECITHNRCWSLKGNPCGGAAAVAQRKQAYCAQHKDSRRRCQ